MEPVSRTLIFFLIDSCIFTIQIKQKDGTSFYEDIDSLDLDKMSTSNSFCTSQEPSMIEIVAGVKYPKLRPTSKHAKKIKADESNEKIEQPKSLRALSLDSAFLSSLFKLHVKLVYYFEI